MLKLNERVISASVISRTSQAWAMMLAGFAGAAACWHRRCFLRVPCYSTCSGHHVVMGQSLDVLARRPRHHQKNISTAKCSQAQAAPKEAENRLFLKSLYTVFMTAAADGDKSYATLFEGWPEQDSVPAAA